MNVGMMRTIGCRRQPWIAFGLILVMVWGSATTWAFTEGIRPYDVEDVLNGSVLVKLRPGISPEAAETAIRAVYDAIAPADRPFYQNGDRLLTETIGGQERWLRPIAPPTPGRANATTSRLRLYLLEFDYGNQARVRSHQQVFDNDGRMKAFVERLATLTGEIEYWSPNLIDRLAAAPDDPAYLDTRDDVQRHLKHICPEEAWEKLSPQGDAGTMADAIRIVVLDDGCRLDHEDLVRRIWDNAPEAGADQDGNGYISDRSGFDFSDTRLGDPLPQNYVGTNQTINGVEYEPYRPIHGTQMSGIIAAETNNQANNRYIGMAGVTWRANTRLITVRMFGSGGGPRAPAGRSTTRRYDGTLAAFIQGMVYAVDVRAHIINYSATGPDSFPRRDVLTWVYQRGPASRPVICCPAGNGSVDFNAQDQDANPWDIKYQVFPARYVKGRTNPNTPLVQMQFGDYRDILVAVMGSSIQDRPAPRTNYGDSVVDIAAPGERIHTTLHDSPSQYGEVSGTSAATAFVSGGLALYFRYENRLPSAVAMRQHLLTRGFTNTPLPCRFGGARLNLERLLEGEGCPGYVEPGPRRPIVDPFWLTLSDWSQWFAYWSLVHAYHGYWQNPNSTLAAEGYVNAYWGWAFASWANYYLWEVGRTLTYTTYYRYGHIAYIDEAAIKNRGAMFETKDINFYYASVYAYYSSYYGRIDYNAAVQSFVP